MSEAAGRDPVEALFGAIEEGDLAGVRAALAAGTDPRARHGILEKPAILEAADHPELLRALLEAGAEADSADPGGETALLAAARTATL